MSDRTVRNPIIPRCCLFCSQSDRSLRQLQARQLSAKYLRTSQSNDVRPSFRHQSRPRCADASVIRRPKHSGFITFLLLTFRRISMSPQVSNLVPEEDILFLLPGEGTNPVSLRSRSRWMVLRWRRLRVPVTFGSSQEQQRKAAKPTGTVRLVGGFSWSWKDCCASSGQLRASGTTNAFQRSDTFACNSEPFPLIPAATHLFKDCLLFFV